MDTSHNRSNQWTICKTLQTQNDFVWHSHENEDELFMVFKGTLLMDFRNGRTVEVKEGEILIVPKGVEHKPHTNGEIVFNILFEPKTTLHAGTVPSDMTVKEALHGFVWVSDFWGYISSPPRWNMIASRKR